MRRATTIDDRRERILEAALREFATRGYEAASTNAIAEAAGVAKGLVFHHFGNKEALYVAVAEHVIERTVSAMFEGEDPFPADLFERLYQWSTKKLRVFQRDPLGFELLTRVNAQVPPAVKARLDQKYAELVARHWPRFLEGIDASRLRPGLTLAQAMETLMLLAEGLEKRRMPKLLEGKKVTKQQLDALNETAREHFARLRDGLYRPATSRGKRAPARGPRPHRSAIRS